MLRASIARSVCRPWTAHGFCQGNAFVSRPVSADQSLDQRYADGLWHHCEPVARYTFGPRGFDTALKNGRIVSYTFRSNSRARRRIIIRHPERSFPPDLRLSTLRNIERSS